MFTQLRSRAILLLAGALCAGSARGDELDFLPDKAAIVMSGNFQDFLKSKTFVELKSVTKLVRGGEREFDFLKEMEDELGVRADNIARISMTVGFRERGGDPAIGMIRTIKPVTAANIIAARKPSEFRKNATFKEVKVGKYTAHEMQYQYELFDGGKGEKKLSEVQHSDAFCIVEDNLILFGRLHGYKSKDEKETPKGELFHVLSRTGKPTLSEPLKAGLKLAPFSNSGVILLDLENMPEREKHSFYRGLGLDALKTMNGLEALAVTINEKDKVTARATLLCKDEANAAAVKKHADARVVELNASLKKLMAKDPPKEQAMLLRAADEVLHAAKLSVNGNQASAEVAVAPETGMRFLFGYFHIVNESRPRPEKKEEK